MPKNLKLTSGDLTTFIGSLGEIPENKFHVNSTFLRMRDPDMLCRVREAIEEEEKPITRGRQGLKKITIASEGALMNSI